MPYSLTEAQRRAIVRIRTGPDSWGTGFVVGPGLILTAFHVVGDRRAEGTAFHEGERTLEFVDTVISGFEIVQDAWDKAADWALLRFEGDVDVEPLPLSVVWSDDVEWTTYGFPTMQKLDGMLLSGEIENAHGELFETRAIQLHCKQMASGQGGLASGASGSPVIADGRVVGILRFTLADREGQTRGGTLYACPVDLVAGHEGLSVQRDPNRRRRRKVLGGLLAIPALVVAVLAFVPVSSADVRLDLTTTRAEFVLSGNEPSFSRVGELTFLEAGRLSAAIVTPLSGGATTIRREDPLGAILFAPPPAGITLEQVVLPPGTGVTASIVELDGPKVDLVPAGDGLPRFKTVATGPVDIDLFTEGAIREDISVEVDSSSTDLELDFVASEPARIGLLPTEGSQAGLFENVGIRSLRFVRVTRVRTNQDMTLVEGTIEDGGLVFYPGRGSDTTRLEAGDRLEFDSIEGTLTRFDATDASFSLVFQGRAFGPRLVPADSASSRRIEMPKVLGKAWAQNRTVLFVLLSAYLVLVIGFMMKGLPLRKAA